MDPTTPDGARSAPAPDAGGDEAPVGATGTCIVVTGGDPAARSVLDHLPAGALVIGADSGVAHALSLGLHVDLAVGDFDSLDEATLAEAVADGAEVQRHPRAKDATDLELGLLAAVGAGARQVVVVGGHGGRLDHFLANALLLAAQPFADIVVEAHMGPAWVAVARPGPVTTVTGAVGDIVSLLPAGGPATGVTTTGLTYALTGESLAPGTTRGVSNELAAPTATVAVGGGTLLIVKPGELTL